MASAESHVWVGFIEALPVVGSVKEAVEWVLAVAADDSDLAEEKLQVITGGLRKLDILKVNRSPSSSGYSSASTSGRSTPRKTSASLTAMEVESIREVNLMALIMEVGAKHKKGKQPVESQAARQKKVQKVRDETLEKIRRINQNFAFPKNEAPLDDYGKRSGRGEHVINNDVTRIYSKVVDDFMSRYHIPIMLNMACPLDNGTVNAIMNELVVHFNDDEFYINSNALIYGQYSWALKRVLTEFLMRESQESRDHVAFIVNHMNEVEAYVDEFAKVKWIGNQNAKRIRFETIRNEVAAMFSNWEQYFGIVKGRLEELGLTG